MAIDKQLILQKAKSFGKSIIFSTDENGGSKLDIKNILIILFFSLSVVFGTIWYFSSTGNKDAIKQLHSQNDDLLKDRNRIASELLELKKDNKKLIKDKSEIEDRQTKTDILIKRYQQIVATSNGNLAKVKGDLDRIAREIADLRSNPPILTDDELIISLRKKLNVK